MRRLLVAIVACSPTATQEARTEPLPLPAPSATAMQVAVDAGEPDAEAVTQPAALATADAYFDQGKLDLALAAYNDVIKDPPPGNRNWGYAWYKIAYVRWNRGELQESLVAFKHVIDFGASFPLLPQAATLANVARKDIVAVYARVGAPGAAYPFLRRLSGDTGAANDRTFAMMNRLGDAYIDVGDTVGATALFRDLGTRDPAHRCRWDAYVRHTMAWTGRAALDADLARCP